jgi:SAM-dependent methyltransferase
MANDYYRQAEIAQAYDADQRGQAITVDDVPFYLDLAKQAAERGQAVLELGCGTGRVTVAIAAAGADITGVDLAPEMLAVARSKTQGRTNPRWVEADMARFELDARFGLVIIPFRSFLMLLTVAEQKSCLACIREHLVDGGRLAFNIFNPDLRLITSWNRELRGKWQREQLGGGRQLWSTRSYSTAEQSLSETDEYVTESDTGAVISRIRRNLRLRYVFRYEMEHLLRLSGFEVEALYGWFDGRAFDDDSSEMVWIARKTTQTA